LDSYWELIHDYSKIMSCRSLWHINNKESIIKDDELESLGDKSRLLDARYSMISTGTERLVSLGQISNSLYEQMKVPYMKGTFDFPIKYGYSLVGSSANEHFHVMHPHQNKVNVKADECYKLSAENATHRYTLISNIETVINAIWDAQIEDTHSIAIIGFGNIGSLLATTLKHYYHIEATVYETNNWRYKKAIELGFDTSQSNEEKYDIVFHTSATSGGMQKGIDSLKLEGKLVELSWFGSKKVTMELGHSFHYNRLKIVSSQVSHIPKRKPEETYLSRKKLAEEILNLNAFDLLVTDFIKFEDAPVFFSELRKGLHREGLIWIIKY